MGKNKSITPEKMALIASARDYLIDVIACGVAAGMPGVQRLEVETRREKLAQDERKLIAQIEKIDGNQ